METKDQLIHSIKEWVKVDNEMKVLQKELNQRKTEKKGLSTILIDVMRKNEIDCFDINNGQLIYNKKNIKKPISKKELLNVLSKFFEGDSLKASELNEYILNSRTEVIKEEIIRK
jgi:hypothetical protein